MRELVAPASAIFFNKDWIEVGTKSSLAQEISIITKIPVEVLSLRQDDEFSVAQVMSWAANRQTTRVEDMGYCLLGLFGVNMPMIYGEGEKAFLRLQHEITKGSTDQSLFVWSAFQRPGGYRGPFAPLPIDFARCGSVVQTRDGGNSEFFLTNKGLRIEVMLAPYQDEENAFTAYFECAELANRRCRLGIRLHKVAHDQYFRKSPGEVFTPPRSRSGRLDADRTTIYISQPIDISNISRWTNSLSTFSRGGNFTFIVPKNSQGKRKDGFLNVGEAHYAHLDFNLFRSFFLPKAMYTSGQYSVTHILQGGSAFKFEHENNLALQFIVVFRVTEHPHLWSNIELGRYSNGNLDAIVQSYFGDGERPLGSRYHGLVDDHIRDRATLPLDDGSVVSLALKKVLISGETQYMVNITIN